MWGEKTIIILFLKIGKLLIFDKLKRWEILNEHAPFLVSKKRSEDFF